MAQKKNSAGIQIVGLTTASVFLMSFAFLMYRLERTAPAEKDTRTHTQWRHSYLTPPSTARDAVEALIAKRSAPKAPEPREPDFDFYRVLPEFSVYVSPDVDTQRATVARAPVQPAAQAQVITTAATPAPAPAQQPVIIQQQPVITYSQPVPTATLIAAKTAPGPSALQPAAVQPAAAPAAAPGAWLQVGAFSQRGDASRRRAEVALLGLRAHIEPAVIQGATVFRVKLGPFDDPNTRVEANNRLTMAGIESIVKKR